MRKDTVTGERAVKLSLNARVLEQARALGMNVSATVDALLAEEVLKRYRARWNEENRHAIEHCNARIGQDGLPLARYRMFMQQP